MISIIVCSVNEELFRKFEKSVADNIGVEFEIIKIDNTGNRYGICEAYNKGAASAKFEYLCFAHEDILFRSDNWGQVLIKAFEGDEHIGVIGVAGSKYKSLAPSGWPTGNAKADRYQLIQHY